MRKIILALVAGAAVVAGVVAMSAFEAHIINVTAHIENALTIHGDPLHFGTVFPQEYLTKNFTVSLSNSFQNAGRADDVSYVIKQKPKCVCLGNPGVPAECPSGKYAPVSYTTPHVCPSNYKEMLSLCPYLSKTTRDTEDTSEPSYFVAATGGTLAYCQTVIVQAAGHLDKPSDLIDEWTVDLKVPPVTGTVGQDWPAGCPVLPENNKDYGCDLWVEVTEISVSP